MDFNFFNKMDTGDIITELSDPAAYRGYLQSMSRLSSYSWRNIFLIFKQMPHASKLADFNTWKNQYGRKIKMGSTSIKINVPIEQEPIKRLVEKTDPATGAAVLDENSKRILEELIIYPPVEFKANNYMDISQTDGNPLPLLAGDVMSDKSLYEVFTDVLKIISPSVLLQENHYSFWGAIRQIALERLENINSDKSDFIIDSVAYVVCRRFNIETDTNFNALDRYLDADMLETIRKYSDELIIAIEDRFAVICKERGLDPMTLTATAEPKAAFLTSSHNGTKLNTETKPPIKPLYSKELRTDIVAGVEFNQYTVKPLTESEEMTVIETATEITPPTPINPAIKQSKPVERTEPPTLQYLPDTSITIPERNEYGYTRPELLPLNKDRAVSLFRRNMTVYMLNKDNTEVMARYLSDIQNHDGIYGIAYGTWLNSREYIALASGKPEDRLEAKFIYDGGDSFAVYQTEPDNSPAAYKSYEELETQGFDINRHNYNLVYTAPLPAPPSDSPAGLFMWVNAERLDDYKGRSLSISDVLSIKKDEIITSYYANGRTFKELLSFIGEEGRRSERIIEIEADVMENNSFSVEQNAVYEKQEPQANISTPDKQETIIPPVAEVPPQSQTVQLNTPQSETTAVQTEKPPPALPVIKSDLALYRVSVKEAEEHGTTELYETNQRMNRHCAKAVTNAIQTHKKGENRYDMATPAERLIKTYGAERMMWVLSKHILTASEKFSEVNCSWAKSFINDGTGSGDEVPPFTINIHHAILDVFVNELRAVLGKKPTFNELMKTAKKKSEARNNSNG